MSDLLLAPPLASFLNLITTCCWCMLLRCDTSLTTCTGTSQSSASSLCVLTAEAVTVFSSSWVESSTVARSFKVEDVQTMLDQLSSAVYMVHQLTVLGNPCRLQQAPPRVSFKASQAEVLPHASSKLHLEVSTTGVTCARISLSEQGIDTGSVSQRLASECCQALPGGQTDSRPALRGPWPTPTAAEWSKIVQVVTRIAFLLKFLHSLKDEYQHLKEHGQLRVDVMELLCDLLNGHLTNPELDVTKIVVLLFEDVVEELRAIPAERVELSQFRSVLLQRVASDSRLLHSDGIQDPIICPVGSYAVGRLWLSLGTYLSCVMLLSFGHSLCC